ncbi:MAG: hypothetical protein HY556_02815 [Euryarchaeota archaeon]|nr:hypothetical protein [Euryarchaeota archaeon]
MAVGIGGGMIIAGLFAFGPSLLQGEKPPIGCPIDHGLPVDDGQVEIRAPQIWNDWIVWHARSDHPTILAPGETDVYAYRISTGEERVLATGPSFQSVPIIYGTTVVWRDFLESERRIQLWTTDLDTGRSSILPIPFKTELGTRGLYEDLVLFESQTDDVTVRGLYVLNTTSGNLTRLTEYIVGLSEIWKDKVVWLSEPDENPSHRSQLILHNLSTGANQVLAESPPGLSEMDVYENLVAYMVGSGPTPRDDWDIHLLDLARGSSSVVAFNETGPAIQDRPRVAGSWIAYQEHVQGSPRRDAVKAYYVPTAKRITVAEGNFQVGIDVWENRVVYTELNLQGDRDHVFLRCLESPPA